MTELQPTEIELTSKKRKPDSRSKRKLIAFIIVLVLCALIAGLTVILAQRASRTPEAVQNQNQPLPAKAAVSTPAPAK